MKTFKSIIVLVALCAINNVLAVAMQYGAPVPTINGANYRRFAGEYKGYLIDQNNQVDANWVRGALVALLQDGLYDSNNFLNVLWADIEPLVNYYAQGNQAFKNATRQSLGRAFNNVVGTFQVPQPTASPWASRQVVPSRPLPQVPQAQPAQAPQVVKAPSTVLFSTRTVLDGALGSAYASKANEIYSYNQSLALKRGDRSLLGMLNQAIADANANPSPQEAKVAQLKASIDSIYPDLAIYRARDTAQIGQQAAATRPATPVPPAPQQQRMSTTNNIADFVQDSKRQGMVGIRTMNQDWLLRAVGAILAGNYLTNENKASVKQQLMAIADAIMLEPLRNDQSITKDQYDVISADSERQVINFMSKLRVGTIYGSR